MHFFQLARGKKDTKFQPPFWEGMKYHAGELGQAFKIYIDKCYVQMTQVATLMTRREQDKCVHHTLLSGEA